MSGIEGILWKAVEKKQKNPAACPGARRELTLTAPQLFEDPSPGSLKGKKKSKQTEGRCEVISGNSSLIVLFWPPTPHAIQQQRRCAEKKTHARRCERMRLGLRTKCWGLMRSGGGDKERAPSVLQQGVQAKGSEQTNCCQSVGRRRGKQKKAHARTKDLCVSARLCDSVFALNVYMRIH